MFRRVEVNEFPIFDIEHNRDYFLNGTYPVLDEVYKYDNYYVGVELVSGIRFLSIIKEGTATSNILKQCSLLVGELIKKGKVGFFWKKGIKNEILINRLLAKYEITRYNLHEEFCCVVIKSDDVLQQL